MAFCMVVSLVTALVGGVFGFNGVVSTASAVAQAVCIAGVASLSVTLVMAYVRDMRLRPHPHAMPARSVRSFGEAEIRH